MGELSLTNPVFVTYALAGAIMVLKIMLQGWITVVRMMANSGGFVNPEDANAGPANPKPRAGQLDLNDDVDRSRRIHRNDLENIPAFLAIGLLFVLVEPPLAAAQWLMFGFVGARLAHTIAYSTAQSHEVRATFYSIGSLMVMAMAAWVLAVAVQHL
jgi:glutathione S-transferase